MKQNEDDGSSVLVQNGSWLRITSVALGTRINDNGYSGRYDVE
jgi:hypothetical protein